MIKVKFKYKAYEYYRFRRSIVTIFIVLIVDLVMCAGLRLWETDEKHLFVVLGICLILLVLFIFGRQFLIGALSVIDLDYKTLYDIDKRKGNKPENVSINYALSGDCLFYEGRFSEAAENYGEALKHTKKKRCIYAIRHMLILSLFLSENTENIGALIAQQRSTSPKGLGKGVKESEEKYYDFIENFLKGDYNGAIMAIQPLLNDGAIAILNSRKLLVNYLMSIAFSWSGNAEAQAHCKSQVLEADKNRKTIFSYFCSK